MAFNETEAAKWLEAEDLEDDAAKTAFLNDKTEELAASPDQGYSLPVEDIPSPAPTNLSPQQDKEYRDLYSKREQGIYGDAVLQGGEFAYAANREVIGALGLPADAFNWALEALGTDKRAWGGSEDLLELAEKAGVTGREEFDSAASRGGKFAGMGLMFLAPFLKFGKGTVNAMRSGQLVEEGASATTGVMQRVAAPYMTSGKTALGADVSSAAMSGIGSYYGEKEYGELGGLFFGVAAGVPAQMAAPLMPKAVDLGKRHMFQYSQLGHKAAAEKIARDVAETSDVVPAMKKAYKEVLPNAKRLIPPAKMTGDRHLLALHNKIVNKDPKLAHKMQMDEIKVHTMARQEMEELGGNVPLAETQSFIQGKIQRTKDLINANVDLALVEAKKGIGKVTTSADRAALHKEGNRLVGKALNEVDVIQKEAWNKLDQTAPIGVTNTRAELERLLLETPEVTKFASDSDLFPKFMGKYFGTLKKGALAGGDYKNGTTLKEMQGAKSALTTLIRNERSKDLPDFSKIRIWGKMTDAIMLDIEKSPRASEFKEALEISKTFNEKFRGGIMDIILGHEKAGGRVAPEITFESLSFTKKGGPKAAVEIQRVINANTDLDGNINPEAMGMLESLVKLDITRSLLKDGRVNVPKASEWVKNNKDVLKIFPKLADDLDNAIGLEERHIGIATSAKADIKRIEGTVLAKTASGRVRRILPSIMESKNPKLEMRKVFKASNDKGRRGLKNGIIGDMLEKSKSGGELDFADKPVLSGNKLMSAWQKNKDIYSEALSDPEIKRLEIIINTIRRNEGMTNLPDVGKVLEPKKGVIAWIAGFKAVEVAGKAASGPGSLRTASMGGKLSNIITDRLDTRGKMKILTDAVQDPKLFEALFADFTKQGEAIRAIKILHPWLVANSIESLEED